MIDADVEEEYTFIGTNTASSFAFGFPAFENDSVQVAIIDTSLDEDDAGYETIISLGSDYTITGVGRAAGGGSIALVDDDQDWLGSTGKLNTGYSLVITYVPLFKQLYQFGELGPHTPRQIENALDRITMDLMAIYGDNSDASQFVPGNVQTISAGEAIVISKKRKQHIKIQSAGGALAMSTTPFGTDTTKFLDGMEIIIEPQSATDYNTLAELDSASGYKGNGTLLLKYPFNYTFVYSSTKARFTMKALGAV